ncbi:LmeA family phospholipid-binding protein [Streptomyces albipurpureus]|uniref:DUF2993 domain-containing protein n=1 Tax=Streptomyces albipurpureus TaxID=2897419 RepID=A0ABT0V4G5_9ACTN|nr:DUF2993 domain-containing protein [Streptomyces sp. CWNU-1]MCM2394271.1 DUF2993 domain-containing protein [Streptomyces sp. CWNU-1]
MRAVRILLIISVILGGIFIAADRLAVNFAESEAAEKVRTSQGLRSTPEVSIKGFPFLTQVAAKELDEVGISLSGITAVAGGRTVNVTEVRAALVDVRIDSNYSSAVAASAKGSARISYADLSLAAPKGAQVSYAGAERAAKGQVKVSGPLLEVLEGAGIGVPSTFEDLLKGRTVTAYSVVELGSDNAVKLKADSLPKLPVPGFDDEVRRALDYDLKIEGMPAGLKLDRAETTEDGLKFSGTGTNVSLVG